ncbi:hypothetical protein FHS91_002905 [Sphingobium xanthum]|uniref:methyltransferase family protein n=1 Tax=Sphingobium xanthum TaxID=1387165 RepID=UPI001FE37A4E|nr:methyltransferase [Sphingobium xanthum]
MTVEPDSAGVRCPPPFVYLGALLLGLAAERFFTLRSFGIDWRLLAATGALLFIAGGATMLAAAGLFRRLGTSVPPSQPTTLIATTGPYRWTRNPMYLGMALVYAGLAIGFDGPIAFAYPASVGICDKTIASACDFLLTEVRKMGGRLPVLSFNMELRQDDIPLSRQSKIYDHGVAVYFQRNERPIVFGRAACARRKAKP